MKLIVGLGNYPKEYDGTRHNVGFMVVDSFLKLNNLELSHDKFNGRYIKYKNDNGVDVIISKPYTYMNLSGLFVKQLASFYKVNTKDILIVYDDVSLPLGTIRRRISGSSAGQKGIESIISQFGTDVISRVKIGVGAPSLKGALANFVLSKFKKDELPLINEACSLAISEINSFIKEN